MSQVVIALAIPHTSWAPGRKETLAKLKKQLGGLLDGGNPYYLEHDNRSPRREWSEFILRWGAKMALLPEGQGPRPRMTHFLQLQDDLEVAPFFWRALNAMIEARPNDVLCLQSAHQSGPEASAGGYHGYTTIDGLLGPAWVLPTEVLLEFLEWRDKAVLEGGLDAITEDTLMGTFCMVTGKPIWSPLPSIVDHPCQVASTYGNDRAPRQRSTVRWNLAPLPSPRDPPGADLKWDEEALCSPEFWAKPPKHLGRFYDVVPSIARRYVKGYTAADYQRHMAEPMILDAPACSHCGKKEPGVISRTTGALICGLCLRGMAPMIGARFPKPNTPLLIIATPLKGHPHPMHADAVCQLRAEETLNIEAPYEVAAWHQPSDDVVRVRSRIARDVVALKRAGKPVTHLLLVDGDVAPTPQVVHRMLQARKPFVAAPYPARVIDWRGVEKDDGRPAEARAYVYHIEALPGRQHEMDGTGCVPIASIGLGCALIEIALLERMIDHYGKDPDPSELIAELVNLLRAAPDDLTPELAVMGMSVALKRAWEAGRAAGPSLVFDDTPFPGMPSKETVALFMLELGDRRLQSEDRSFCRRVRAMGEKVWMYVGPGAPVDHYGETRYRGMIESLDMRALPAAGKAAE